ncbi:MAG: serine/threonine-protein phosphatase [Brachymonas sp.]|nr:serine/threonine-protein phosphatase [Brachymonas sp.]
MKFNVFQLSRKGGRKNNEDRMGYCYTRDAALFVLADGMGGHAEGEVAAQLALQTMAAQFQQQAQPTVKKPAEFLAESLLAAHHCIVRYAGERGLPDTPRTTLVAALVQNGHAMWVHCGDSRLYVVREGKVLLRTRDHSYMEQGEFFAANVENIYRSVLFTCLGSPSRPIFDVSLPMRLRQKDRIMLCSDGLWGNLSDEEIQGYLADVDRPLSTGLPEMVEEALRRGGDTCDNTTVLAMGWDMPSTPIAPEVVTDSILEGVFASTIQSAFLTTEDADEMNDDEIERSIAEINAAINRVSSSKKT